MLNRDDYRKIKSMSREEMGRWLDYHNSMLNNSLRKKYDDAYKDELDNSVQNFITAIAYTLHFNEDINLKNDELASFMEDLYVSVEMFRKGEYNPEEYRDALREDGIEISKYDYDKIYREYKERIENQYKRYKEYNEKAIKTIDDLLTNDTVSCGFDDLQSIKNILKGE